MGRRAAVLAVQMDPGAPGARAGSVGQEDLADPVAEAAARWAASSRCASW